MKLVPQGSVRKSAVSLACLALTGVYLVHTYAHAPRAQEMRSREARLHGLLEGIRQAADGSKPDGSSLDERLAAYELTAEQLEVLIPSGDEVPALMEAVTAAERRAGVEMTTFRPEPPEPGEPYELWSYQLGVRGSYHAIGAFITAVGSLGHIAVADDVIIAAESTVPDASGRGLVTVVASFRMRLRVRTNPRDGSPELNDGM